MKAHGAEQGHSESRQYATFYLEEHLLGVAVLNVQEVLTAQQMTSVPLAPPMIGGLINLRGQIVTAIDLRTRLGFAKRPADMDPMNVVIQTFDGLISLLVDRIGDVMEVRRDLFELLPDTVDGRLREVTEGVYKLPDRLLLALDTAALIQSADTAI